MKENQTVQPINSEAKCPVCSHGCRVYLGDFGYCGVRKNVDGEVVPVTYGHLIARQVDPIEKKPLYHFLPGTAIYSIASPGCNFTCKFCQNWEISQLRGESLENYVCNSQKNNPETVVNEARKYKCRSIAFTYTEPTLFFEYMMDVARCAKEQGLRTVVVSNGFMSLSTLQKMQPFIDAFNIDLKSFSEEFYRDVCGARLAPVLDTLKAIRNFGNWLEVTTLLIPGKNDSDREIHAIAGFMEELGRTIPWHISRFFPRYQFTHEKPTEHQKLLDAYTIGKSNGLTFVYIGNHRGTATMCPNCSEIAINREGYATKLTIESDGLCKKCGYTFEGVWK